MPSCTALGFVRAKRHRKHWRRASTAYVALCKTRRQCDIFNGATHAKASRKELASRSTHCAHRCSLAVEAATRGVIFMLFFFFINCILRTPLFLRHLTCTRSGWLPTVHYGVLETAGQRLRFYICDNVVARMRAQTGRDSRNTACGIASILKHTDFALSLPRPAENA